MVRLLHGFPSALDGLVTGVLVAIAGGDPAVAVRLGLAMFLLQCSIGALNDRADAPVDQATQPGKPIPRGEVTRREASVVTGACLVGGLVLAALSGPSVLLVALLGVGCGYAYDLWLKGTALSWLAWSAGLPLLPLNEGAAFFALRSRRPIVPVAINGTGWLGFGRVVRVRIGEPIEATGRPTRETVEALTARTWTELHGLLTDFSERPPPGPFGRWLTEIFNEWPEGSRPQDT